MLITKRLLISSWAVLLLLTTGCTNTLHQADLNVLNSEGKSSQVIVYWTKTEKLIGKSKAGPLVLMTACSNRRLNFDDTGTGIIFRGDPSMDRLLGHTNNVLEGAVCGQVENATKISELTAGPLLLTIKCEAVSDDFSIGSSSYIQARKPPYQFEVQETNHWSFSGTILEAPQSPVCK